MESKENINYALVKVETPEDWEIYHRIRRQELFEARGKWDVYNSEMPEEKIPNNTPFLLKADGVGVGTARLDIREDGTAVVRLVAVTKKEQGKGHGRELAILMEEFARAHGVKKLLVNAHVDATGYYEKLGFIRQDWDSKEHKDSILQMVKILA